MSILIHALPVVVRQNEPLAVDARQKKRGRKGMERKHMNAEQVLTEFINSWFGIVVFAVLAIGCFIWAICLAAEELYEFIRQRK